MPLMSPAFADITCDRVVDRGSGQAHRPDELAQSGGGGGGGMAVTTIAPGSSGPPDPSGYSVGNVVVNVDEDPDGVYLLLPDAADATWAMLGVYAP